MINLYLQNIYETEDDSVHFYNLQKQQIYIAEKLKPEKVQHFHLIYDIYMYTYWRTSYRTIKLIFINLNMVAKMKDYRVPVHPACWPAQGAEHPLKPHCWSFSLEEMRVWPFIQEAATTDWSFFTCMSDFFLKI